MKPFLLLPLAIFLGAAIANAQSTSPTVTATPTALTFSWVTGTTLPIGQKITLKASSGTPSYTITTPPTDGWLIAVPDTGVTSSPITVRVNPTTLGPGTYNSTISIAVNGIANPVTVAVTMNVTLPSGGAVVAPTAMTFTYPGTNTGTFTINGGPSALSFNITSSAAWLSFSPNAGVLLPSASQTITVTANAATMTPQTTAYTGTISVAMSSGLSSKPQTVTVSLTVNSQTPTITTFWPTQIPIGSGDTPVTLRGANFYGQTSVTAAGASAPLKVTVLSSDTLLATLPAALLTAAGSVSLTVTNPAPGGAAAPVVIPVGSSPFISGITNAASFATGPVSPGEIVAIFGASIGPATPALESISNGYVQGDIGNVDVQIGGIDAPILYASSGQVTIQVPYNVPLGTQAQGTGSIISLTYGSNPPVTATTDVVATAPGIFTVNASGAGQALVLDFDASTSSYTVNSSNTPAHIGDTITFFVTGEGDYASSTYSPETGFVVPLNSSQYPQINPLPTITIGGVAVTNITYAGPIPTSIMGLLQINAVVPTGVTAGKAVPLVVTIGSAQTQANVTMAVSQ